MLFENLLGNRWQSAREERFFFLFCVHIRSFEVTKLELRCNYSSTAQLDGIDEPSPCQNGMEGLTVAEVNVHPKHF